VAALHPQDYQRILTFLEQLYAFQDDAALPRWLVREIPKLVGCHHCTWNDIVVARSRSTVVEYPVLDDADKRMAIFSAHLLEHPGLVNNLATGDLAPFVLSDFLSAEALHRTNLYQRLFRAMDYEDQVGMLLSPPAGRMNGVALARDRRGFSARDREVMRLIRPHLAIAKRNMDALARARGQLLDDPDCEIVSLIETNSEGGVKRGLERAYPILERFFPEERRHMLRGLPTDLNRWLRNGRHKSFVHDRGDRRLVARFFAATPRQGLAGCVLLQEQSGRRGAASLRRKGLTLREVDILMQMEKGYTNEEIAVNLFISPRTVKKHLENIYRKVGVSNRTGALYWMRRETAG